MSDYFLSQVMNYLREGKVKIEFIKMCGGESFIYYIDLYNLTNGKRYRFKTRRTDEQVIRFMLETEGLEKYIIN